VQILLLINKVSDTTKKGRETGVRTEYPSRDLTSLYKGLPSKNGRKGGTFWNPWFWCE